MSDDDNNLSPFWCVRREVRRTIPDADKVIVDLAALETMRWWFRSFRLIGEAYGDKDNLVIPREAFDKWVVKYGL